MRDPFPIVAMLGRRLEGERTGWRDMKGLVLMVAMGGPEEDAWPIAQDVAAALGLDEEQQESIYRDAYGERPGATTTGRGTSHADTRVHRHRDDEPQHEDSGRDRSSVGGGQQPRSDGRVPAYPGFR